ncbi:MAG: L,D-transpeptidase family protein [Solirubrobacterales bacterium]
MKNKKIKLPLLFMAFGIVVIFTLSYYSIKKQLNIENTLKNISMQNKDSSNDDAKLFYTKPEVKPKNTSIKVYKSKRILELYGDNNIIGRFKIGLGRSPEGNKEKEGDSKTPEGKYYICTLNNQTKYYFFMGLSYPNEEDAKRGLESGLINENTYKSIVSAINNKQQPPWNTELGGAIGIHGGGTTYDWTYGCIAMENTDLEILKQYAAVNTPVEIEK